MPPKAAPKAAAKKGPPAAMLAKLKAQLDFQKAEEERLQREAEEEERRLREEERLAEEQRKFEEEEAKRRKEELKVVAKAASKDKKKQAQLEMLERMRAAGMIVPDVPPEGAERPKITPAAVPRPKPKPKPKPVVSLEELYPSDSGQDVDEDDWEAMAAKEERRDNRRKQRAAAQKAREKAEAEAAKAAAAAEEAAASGDSAIYGEDIDFKSDLRSPICCVLGHVDTGKTSLLDKIRSTNVQKGEAGGITQQIGATFFPRSALLTATAELNKKYNHQLKVPGLLVIDTPGHESFTNLRSRGSSLCDIAVLVIDIMHGLEQQTRESIQLLKDRKCPFLVALNKVDRLYDWVPHPDMDIEQTLSLQPKHVLQEYETRVAQVILQLNECGLNAELYYKNKDVKKYVSVVPTSAVTGEGICDLLLLKIQLVQRFMEGKVTFKEELQCTVLEVKPIQGIGTTIDVVLVNGTLHEGDQIVVCGLNKPIVTTIRALLTPQPMKELRVRGDYVHHKKVKAALGIKIAANDLEDAVPGTQLLVVKPGQDPKNAMLEVQKDMNSVMGSIKKVDIGVAVQSSTLGSLEALMTFLKDSDIPVASVALGPMHKRHLLQTISMKERNPKFAVVLAFDVVITREAQEAADQAGIKIFSARIIYHLFDAFKKYCKEYEEALKEKNRAIAVFPCQLKVIDSIRAKDPMILGCAIERGQLRVGSQLCLIREIAEAPEAAEGQEDVGMSQTAPEGLEVTEEELAAAKKEKKKKEKSAAKRLELIHIGKVIGMQRDGKDEDTARAPIDVAVKLHTPDRSLTVGRHFNIGDTFYSEISRASIDALKESFKDEMSEADWHHIIELKKLQGIKDAAKKK